MGQAERHVHVPAVAQRLHRVGMGLAHPLGCHIVEQAVLGDRIEQPLFVAEYSVDRGCLHTVAEQVSRPGPMSVL